MVQGAGGMVQGAGGMVQGAGGMVQGAGGMVQGAGGMVQGAGGMVQGAGGAANTGPYAPRSGPFKVLVYSRTEGFRHGGAIDAGRVMMQQMAAKQGFEVVMVGGDKADPPEPDNLYFTPEKLAEFEVVFMLNPTGDALDPTHQAVFDAWMAEGGGMIGTHAAADCEKDWGGYKDYTMQYYDGHSENNQENLIQFEPAALTHPAIAGLPNPWPRRDEWYSFDSSPAWASAQQTPGLILLGRLAQAASGGGNAPPANQPIMWAREHNNFRVFYTAIGHHDFVFQDPLVVKHLTGGLMWAARREHLIKP
jgi:type 1 glutamine amidotransferase